MTKLGRAAPFSKAPRATAVRKERGYPDLKPPKSERWPWCLAALFLSMVMALINPHRLGFSCTRKSTLLVEIDGPPIRDQHMHVKGRILLLKPSYYLRADPLSLKFGKDNQVRK